MEALKERENKRYAGQKRQAKPAQAAGFCVYIGPTIRGVIQQGCVIPGDRARALEALQPAIDKYPGIAGLVSDGESLPADRTKVKTAGALLNRRYRELAGSVKKEKEGRTR